MEMNELQTKIEGVESNIHEIHTKIQKLDDDIAVAIAFYSSFSEYRNDNVRRRHMNETFKGDRRRWTYIDMSKAECKENWDRLTHEKMQLLNEKMQWLSILDKLREDTNQLDTKTDALLRQQQQGYYTSFVL